MPRYSGPVLALGALSRAIGDTFTGATEGLQGAEKIRYQQALEQFYSGEPDRKTLLLLEQSA